MSQVAAAGKGRHPAQRYIAIARIALQQTLAYRGTAVFTVLILFLWIGILFSFWGSAYEGRERIAGYSLDEMRTYILLAYAINALVGWRVGSGMMARIRTGEIVIDMIRPLNYRTTQLAIAVGNGIVEGFISFGIAIGLGLLFFDIEPPESSLVSMVFIISVLPGWLRVITEILPLRGIVATPVSIYLGGTSGLAMLGFLGLQVGWLALLWWFTDKAWIRAFRAVEIQGG